MQRLPFLIAGALRAATLGQALFSMALLIAAVLPITSRAQALPSIIRASTDFHTVASDGANTSAFDYETAQQLQKLASAKDTTGALELIRRIFAALPPSETDSTHGNADYVIARAISSLKQFKKTEEFITAAQAQLANDPSSLALNYQLALLTSDADSTATTEIRPSGGHPAPLWVKLARAGNSITGFYGSDGEHWQLIGDATIDLGSEPLAALAAASSQVTPRAPNVIVDHVTLTPLPAEGSPEPGAANSPPSAELPLPVPWKELFMTSYGATDRDVPPSTWRDGVFTLRAAGWDLWGVADDTRLIHRPLGGTTEMKAHLASVEGPDANTKAGIMLRRDLSIDSPYAAVLSLPGGGLTFQHRDRKLGRATAYWRKIAELQPGEGRFQRGLARQLARKGAQAEAITIYDRLIASDPDDAFSSYNDLRTVYGASHLSDVADRLLAWKPRETPSGSARSYPSYNFSAVAKACADRKERDKAIALCRRGLELDSNMSHGSFVNSELFELLLDTLIAQKRAGEARDALLECYLPMRITDLDANGRPINGQNASNWMRNNVRWNTQDISLDSLKPLEIANKAGLLGGLQKVLEEKRVTDPEDFAENALEWLLAIVKIDRRDPGVLSDLSALLTAPADQEARNSGSDEALIAVRMEIARRLLRWPGQEVHALEAFHSGERYASQMSSQYNASTLRALVALQQAHTQLELGDPSAAAATLDNLATTLASSESGSRRNDETYIRTCLNLLLRAGPEADSAYLKLYAHATGTDQGKKDYYFGYALEKNLRTGDNPHFQAMAWLLDDGADTPDATLVYELRVTHPYDKNGLGKYPGSRGRSFPGSEGERTLKFSYGPDADHFAPIGELKTTKTFGTWKGAVPPGNGVLKVTIDAPRTADAAALAAETANAPATPVSSPAANPSPSPTPPKPPADYYLRVVRTPNLIKNPSFDGSENRDPKAASFSLPGWADLPAGLWKQGTSGGPRPDRPFVIFDPAQQQTDLIITGARIPMEAGHAYFQSAWLRDPGFGGNVVFGRRYLDANGNELKRSECPDASTLLWRWNSQRLQTGINLKDGDAIPAETAFIEPFLKVHGAVNWTGLFLGKADDSSSQKD